MRKLKSFSSKENVGIINLCISSFVSVMSYTSDMHNNFCVKNRFRVTLEKMIKKPSRSDLYFLSKRTMSNDETIKHIE